MDIHTNEIIFSEDDGNHFVLIPYSFELETIIAYSPYCIDENSFHKGWTEIVNHLGDRTIIDYPYDKLKEDRRTKENMDIIHVFHNN